MLTPGGPIVYIYNNFNYDKYRRYLQPLIGSGWFAIILIRPSFVKIKIFGHL